MHIYCVVVASENMQHTQIQLDCQYQQFCCNITFSERPIGIDHHTEIVFETKSLHSSAMWSFTLSSVSDCAPTTLSFMRCTSSLHYHEWNDNQTTYLSQWKMRVSLLTTKSSHCTISGNVSNLYSPSHYHPQLIFRTVIPQATEDQIPLQQWWIAQKMLTYFLTNDKTDRN